ncbi:MAG: iron-sulfur cluster assembly scaffold protein, partial [Planctomycetota bacterium]
MDACSQLAAHGREPRNMGRLDGADGTATVGSIMAGRALRWFVRLDGERVAEARYQV